jgi:hypothetical protein
MFVQNLWASKCKNGMKNKFLKNSKIQKVIVEGQNSLDQKIHYIIEKFFQCRCLK